MSRTDKDMPYWVVTEWYTPEHAWRCVNGDGWRVGDRPCTLPPAPIREPPRWSRRITKCHWEPAWPYYHHRYRGTWGPSSRDLHLYWWGPDRAKTRACLGEAKKQYNCSHEVEIVERALQHRHSPSKGWWD